MNKERLLHIADVLESDRAQKHFDMRDFFSDDVSELAPKHDLNKCGTTACIAGWIINEYDPEYADKMYGDRAAELIDCIFEPGFYASKDNNVYHLFIPPGDSDGIYCNDPKIAAKVVRNYANTGEIIWDQVCPDQPNDEIGEE